MAGPSRHAYVSYDARAPSPTSIRYMYMDTPGRLCRARVIGLVARIHFQERLDLSSVLSVRYKKVKKKQKGVTAGAGLTASKAKRCETGGEMRNAKRRSRN